MPVLPDSLLKLTGARDSQLKQLHQEITEFLDGEPYEWIDEVDSLAREIIARLRFRRPDEIWGLLISEIIHLLRSALDNAVHELLFPGAKVRMSKTCEFPIFDTASKYFSTGRSGGRFKIAGLRQDAIDIIDARQPHLDGPNAHSHPLWVLQELWNWDKHCVVHTAVFNKRYRNPVVTCSEDNEIVSVRMPGILEDNAEMFRYRPTGRPARLESYTEMDAEINMTVTFDEAGPASSQEVLAIIPEIGDYVRETLLEFFELP